MFPLRYSLNIYMLVMRNPLFIGFMYSSGSYLIIFNTALYALFFELSSSLYRLGMKNDRL
jgi:uncharacterized membrane protein YoaT (DUF817 family)